jgi:hypothetical protein
MSAHNSCGDSRPRLSAGSSPALAQYFNPAFGETAAPSGVILLSDAAGDGANPPSASVSPKQFTAGFRSLCSNACVVDGTAPPG